MDLKHLSQGGGEEERHYLSTYSFVQVYYSLVPALPSV